MRFYTSQHRHSCGIDRHTKTMYVRILDRDGQVLIHKNLSSNPEAFLAAVAPYRDTRLEKRHGKGKALSILAHKLGRAAYYMLLRGKAFEIERFVATAN